MFAFACMLPSGGCERCEENNHYEGRGTNGKNEANGGECGFLPRGESSESSVAANEPNIPIFDGRDLLPRISVAPVVPAVEPALLLDVAPVAHTLLVLVRRVAAILVLVCAFEFFCDVSEFADCVGRVVDVDLSLLLLVLFEQIVNVVCLPFALLLAMGVYRFMARSMAWKMLAVPNGARV